MVFHCSGVSGGCGSECRSAHYTKIGDACVRRRLAKCSFRMIPLSRHSVDRSPRAFHSSTDNVVRASCFEVLSASVESRKLFLDVSLCLAGRWPWSGCLGAAICVGGNLTAYVGRGYPRQCIQAGYWGSL